VLAQDPAAGTEIAADGGVILQAGVANQAVAVPDVGGATRDDAQRILEAAGLTLGVIEPGDAPGDARVDFQSPSAGGQARVGSPVNVILVEDGQADEDAAGEDPPAPPGQAPADPADPAAPVAEAPAAP
jgi:beta-lactam-binding protein with PASTA domain